MPVTHSRYSQDLGFSDGVVFYPPASIIATGGASTITRNAPGDFSHNAGAAVAPVYSFNLTEAQILRTGLVGDHQLQFGGTGIYPDARYQGRPDTIGSMNTGQQITPRAGNKIKGIKFNSLSVVYRITGAALTAHTCRCDKVVYVGGTVLATTVLLASGTNGLTTALDATNMLVVEVPLTTQAYHTNDLTEIWFEVAPTTQAGGAYRMYGIRAKVEFNFN